MKTLLISGALWLSMSLFAKEEPAVKVSKTFSDRQIDEAKQQIQQRFGKKVDIVIRGRNTNGDMIGLTFVRYNKTNRHLLRIGFMGLIVLEIRKLKA